jgi:hypothetical protein
VLFSFAVPVSHCYSLGMTLDEDSLLLLGCNHNCSAMGLLEAGSDMAEVLTVVTLPKAV